MQDFAISQLFTIISVDDPQRQHNLQQLQFEGTLLLHNLNGETKLDYLRK